MNKFLKELEQSLEQLRLTTVQKPKFSFKRKSATTRPPGASTEKPNVVAVPSSKSKTHVNSSGNRIVSNRRKQYIDWSSITSSGSSASDLTISDLDHCIVNFATSNEVPSNTHDAPKQHLITALHVRNVTDSVLLFPPIEGSALLHDLNRCTIVLGCHQVS